MRSLIPIFRTRFFSTKTPTSIVSNFLTLGTPGTPAFRIALFKRSDSVRIYKNLYAAISGSIESTDATPMAAALREIQEETSLTLTNIELLREGRAYTISDDKLKQEFRIYPFAWKLKGWNGGEENEDFWKDRMILNSENTGVVFFRPEDVARMKKKVPNLEKGVEAVLEEA